jgi:hypothetical protein
VPSERLHPGIPNSSKDVLSALSFALSRDCNEHRQGILSLSKDARCPVKSLTHVEMAMPQGSLVSPVRHVTVPVLQQDASFKAS